MSHRGRPSAHSTGEQPGPGGPGWGVGTSGRRRGQAGAANLAAQRPLRLIVVPLPEVAR